MSQANKPQQAKFSPAQAVYVLERAIADRKLTKSDVNEYISQVHEEIRGLELRLASLRDSVIEPVKQFVRAVEEKVTSASEKKGEKKQRRKKAPISPERRKVMQLQGQYLGLITKTPENQRAKFKKMLIAEGKEATIAAMKKALEK